MKECKVCGKEFSGGARAKFCSEACKQKNKRLTVSPKAAAETGAVVEPRSTEKIEDKVGELSYTDLLFEKHRPNYYRFSNEAVEKECVLCKKRFTTKLQLLRFCSPDCQSQVMVAIANPSL